MGIVYFRMCVSREGNQMGGKKIWRERGYAAVSLVAVRAAFLCAARRGGAFLCAGSPFGDRKRSVGVKKGVIAG
jgi:hypothetical protein